MKHQRDKLQLSDESAGSSARAPAAGNAPPAVALPFLAHRQGVSCLTSRVMYTDSGVAIEGEPTARKPFDNFLLRNEFGRGPFPGRIRPGLIEAS